MSLQEELAKLEGCLQKCSGCSHVQFGSSVGKYGQEYFCDMNNANITEQILYDSKKVCPLLIKNN